MIAERIRTAGPLVQMPGILQALIAFRRVSAALARSKFTRQRSIIEGRKLALEAEQLKALGTGV